MVQSNGADMIKNERLRQITEEGYEDAQDDSYVENELVRAAVTYALGYSNGPGYWPWHPTCYKPGNPIRDLIKAGALIAAEIDRRLRAS